MKRNFINFTFFSQIQEYNKMKTHTLLYRVPYADVDQMGYVYYANYLVYFERGRNELLREYCLPYIELEKNGIMLPVIEAHCEYKKPAHYDDELSIVTCAEDVKGIRAKLSCKIFRGNELLASGYTWHVPASSTGQPCRMPISLLELFE